MASTLLMTMCLPGTGNGDFLEARRRSSSAGVADLMPLHCCIPRRDGLSPRKRNTDGSEYCSSCGADQALDTGQVVYYGPAPYKPGKSKSSYIKPPWKEDDEEEDTVPELTPEEQEAKYRRRVSTVYDVATRLRNIGDEVIEEEEVVEAPIPRDYWSFLDSTTGVNGQFSVLLHAITFVYLLKKRRAHRKQPAIQP
ncbi:hypothetical protein NP493_303g01007 [Ridgeia piscesae]|uniref:Uncharacterized protein n=1 Tax=Ridgeia piscesae TaxID=27915 RepID=A0AAD9NV70_RIDPI|nr:hypothetical protein NP493_303g01007 [Ridgeia piscesae]